MSARRLLRAVTLILAVVLLGGCSPNAEEQQTLAFGETIVREVNALRVLFGIRGLVVLVIGLGLLVLANSALQAGVRLVWRLGFDVGRRLQTWAATGRVLIIVFGLILLARRLAAAAPVLLTLTLLLISLAVVAAYAGQLPSIVVGLTLLLKRRVRQGDRLQIAGHTGTVREVGLTQVQVRGSDGATLFIPNRLITEQVLSVEHSKNSEPVRVEIAAPRACNREQLELLRRAASLSPYRVPGSPVEVEELANEHGYAVEIQVWSDRAARDAEHQLVSSLTGELTRLAEAPKEPAKGTRRPPRTVKTETPVSTTQPDTTRPDSSGPEG